MMRLVLSKVQGSPSSEEEKVASQVLSTEPGSSSSDCFWASLD